MIIPKNNDSDFERLEIIYNIMLHDMADQLTTDYHSQAWVINHYFKEAYEKYKKLEGGKQIMKVMISQPMSDVTDLEIKKIQSQLKEKFAKYHIEVIDSYIEDDVESDINHPGVFYLGKTLMDSLSKVDAVYFVDGWQRARGCRIERKICEEYHIMILDSSFFKHENEIHIRSDFINSNNMRVMPCQNKSKGYDVDISMNNHLSILNDQFGPDIYTHIPQIHDMEEE